MTIGLPEPPVVLNHIEHRNIGFHNLSRRKAWIEFYVFLSIVCYVSMWFKFKVKLSR